MLYSLVDDEKKKKGGNSFTILFRRYTKRETDIEFIAYMEVTTTDFSCPFFGTRHTKRRDFRTIHVTANSNSTVSDSNGINEQDAIHHHFA